VLQSGEYPPDVTASVQYGAGVEALVSKLSVDHKMPLEQIGQLFADRYGYDLNSATIEDVLELGYELAAPLEKQTIAHLQEEEIAHFDETGMRVAGKLHWLHSAATETHTHLFIHEKRGFEALTSEASVLKDFTGTAVHDCWSPYFKFDEARHVPYGAHLLRELNSLVESGSLWAEDRHGFLLTLYKMPCPIAAAAEALWDHSRPIGA
jgi:transposase